MTSPGGQPPDSAGATPTPDQVAAAETASDRPEFWNGVLRAVGVDPRKAREVGGASGVRHAALAVGVDETEKRIVVVSADGDPRSAALAQADIQAAIADYKVIVAKPTLISARQFASELMRSSGASTISMQNMGILEQQDRERFQAQFTELYETRLSGAFEVVDNWFKTSQSVGGLSFLQIAKQIIDQLTFFSVKIDEQDVTVDLSAAIESSPMALDSQLGICGFPLYAMTESELDVFAGGGLDEAQAILRRYGVMQFFFPAPDQLLLGAIDRGAPVTGDSQPAAIARGLGHPSGQMELVAADTKLTELLDALKEKNFLVDGEVSVHLSEEGLQERATVRFTPRESILSKIINRITVNIDLKQMFGIQIGTGSPRDPGRTPGE